MPQRRIATWTAMSLAVLFVYLAVELLGTPNDAVTGAGVSGVGRVAGGPFFVFPGVAAGIVALIVTHIFWLSRVNPYDVNRLRRGAGLALPSFAAGLIGSVASFSLITAAIPYYLPQVVPVARPDYVSVAAVGTAAVALWRGLLVYIRQWADAEPTRILVVGTGTGARSAAEEIHTYSRYHHEVIGFVAERDETVGDPYPYLGETGRLPEIVRKHRIDEILVIGEMLAQSSHRLLDIIRACDETRARAYILPSLYESMMGRLHLCRIGGVPLVELKARPISASYLAVKRMMDVVVSLIGLFLALPILLVAAVAVKFDSPGPVFYRQVRMGRGGRKFTLTKLRTMRVDAEKYTGPVWASKNDPRVTGVGRFLRSKRIDEIPQLWNVLKGDMSLVGPRPERPFFYEEFSKDLPLFPLRLRVKPGLTALSHVWGRYDSTPGDRLRYDLVYMSNVSLWTDVRVLCETARIVLTGEGAQ
ncbi:MAG: sugar transferase [Phycisphaerae bacterium]|nr:sugar transferase [Phycisphaerae bacterium]